MKPKSKVGAGMRRGTPILTGSARQRGAQLPPWGPQLLLGGTTLSLVLLARGSQLHPPPADKEIIPQVWAPGVRRASDGAPFPLSARRHPAKIEPETGWCCTGGTLITGHGVWFSCFSSSEEEPLSPGACDLLRGSPVQRRLRHILLSPAHWLLLKTFAIFSLGFSVTQCRKLSLQQVFKICTLFLPNGSKEIAGRVQC